MNLTLYTLRTGEQGTFGEFLMNGERLCVTVERPWLNNQNNISCIPAGMYDCIPHNTEKYPNVWEITGVPHRSAILIHNANTADQVQGCVGVGSQFGAINGKQAVLNSRVTLEMLRKTLPDRFKLTVIRNW